MEFLELVYSLCGLALILEWERGAVTGPVASQVVFPFTNGELVSVVSMANRYGGGVIGV